MNRRSALKLMVSGTAAATATAIAVDKAVGTDSHVQAANAVGMLYDATLCVGCKACVAACSEANDLKPDTGLSGGLHQAPISLNSSTKNIIKLYREGDEQSYMKAQCMHCLDPACMNACMLHALSKDDQGIVYWDGTVCVGCRYCQIACPYTVPQFEWTSYNPRIVKCELCRHRLAKGDLPACVEVCPREAVIFGKRDDLLKEGHRRIEASPDRYLPKIYGEFDGGGTQVLYLAGVDFEKLGLPDLGERALPETVRNVQGTIYNYFIAPVAVYTALAMVIRRNLRKEKESSEAEGGRAGEDQS